MSEAKLALITGASSGIGRAMADELVTRGWRVAALARREDRLREFEANHAATPGADGPVILATERVLLGACSKFRVRALAYGLRNEWRTKGVAVVHVSPGFSDTDIVKVDNRGFLQESAAKALPKHLVARLEDVVPDRV
jgi:NADP-dependent 3-hydroxy acid dehydrogenase YdfG